MKIETKNMYVWIFISFIDGPRNVAGKLTPGIKNKFKSSGFSARVLLHQLFHLSLSLHKCISKAIAFRKFIQDGHIGKFLLQLFA